PKNARYFSFRLVSVAILTLTRDGSFESPDFRNCSIASSAASSSFCPELEKIFIPLSSYELCEAEMTTPASASSARVKKATPGVVITPAERAPACAAPPPPARTRPASPPLPPPGLPPPKHNPETRLNPPLKSTRQQIPNQLDCRSIERILARHASNTVRAK